MLEKSSGRCRLEAVVPWNTRFLMRSLSPSFIRLIEFTSMFAANKWEAIISLQAIEGLGLPAEWTGLQTEERSSGQLETTGPEHVVGFLDQDCCQKSIAIQIPHDPGYRTGDRCLHYSRGLNK